MKLVEIHYTRPVWWSPTAAAAVLSLLVYVTYRLYGAVFGAPAAVAHQVAEAYAATAGVVFFTIWQTLWFYPTQVRQEAPRGDAGNGFQEPVVEYPAETKTYVREDDGWVKIYDIRLTRAQLEAVHRLVEANRNNLVVDLLARQPNKFFTTSELAQFKEDLVAQSLAERRGKEIILTSRGRSVIRQKYREDHPSPTMNIRRVKTR